MVDQLKISVETIDKASKNLAKIDKNIGKLEKSAKSASSVFKNAFSVAIGNIGARAAVAGFNAISGAAKDLFKTFITDGVAAAKVQEDAINKLNQALAQSGEFSKEASDELQEYASSLQSVTKFGDEAILETQALIQSLGQLDKEGLKEATKATLDLSAALGIDLNAAALLVGKAAAGEVSTFSRYGLIIEKGADASKTFANALDAINTRFGGAASAQVNTFSGATQQLENTFGDLTETFGFFITNNAAVTKGIGLIEKAIREFDRVIKDNEGAINSFINGLVQGFANGIPVALKIFQGFLNFLDEATFTIKNNTSTIRGAIALLKGESLSGFIEKETERVNESKKSYEERNVVFNEIIESSKKLAAELSNTTDADAKQQEQFEKTSAAARDRTAANKELTESQKELGALGVAIADQEAGKDPVAALQIEQQALNEQRELGLVDEQMFAERSVQIVEGREAAKQEALNEALAQKKISEEQFAIASVNITDKAERDKTKIEQRQNALRLQATSSALGNLATLQSSSNKTIFRIGQAAAGAQAVVDGVAAVQKALASAPPPFNFILAATVGAATAANVAKIASAKPPGLQAGLTEVPGPFNVDQFPAVLAGGERVVSAPQNQDLSQFIEENRNIGNQVAALTAAVVDRPISVQINERELVLALNDASDSGRLVTA